MKKINIKCINVLILALLTNPVNAGFDDVWRERIAKPPQEVGIASIYHDHRTATGERFNPRLLTCAHKTRPLCTAAQDRLGICPARSYPLVRLAGKEVRCRVSDRGPFIKGRIIDLSPASAKALGLTWKMGIAKVSLD